MSGLPLLFAFAAGMVATVNPCGFAMLPAYLSFFLSDGPGAASPRPVARGLAIGGVTTLSFVAVFGALGALTTAVSSAILRFVPWAALLIGVALVVLGIAVVGGRHLRVPTLALRPRATTDLPSMAVFGAAYGVASVSCTLPVFLAVATQALAAPNLLVGWGLFAVYGLGMGVVLTALAVALASSRELLLGRLRRLVPYVERVGGWLLVISGAYVVYYWAVALAAGPQAGGLLTAPHRWVGRLSGWLTQVLGAAPLLWAGLALVIVTGAVVIELTRRSGQREEVPDGRRS